MVLTARLPTAMATMLLPLMFKLAPCALIEPADVPLACTLALLIDAFTDVKLYWTLVIDALAVFKKGVKEATDTLLLTELP